jgi:hypothetical protein
VVTLVERASRYLTLVALPDGYKAKQVRPSLAAAVTRLPEQLRRSLTWDQGKEMAEHTRFSVGTGVAVYFCDPRSPWQRASNESTNGLLRQYLTKNADLQQVTRIDWMRSPLNSTVALDKPLASRPSQVLAERCPDYPLRPPSSLRQSPTPPLGSTSQPSRTRVRNQRRITGAAKDSALPTRWTAAACLRLHRPVAA